MISLIHLLFFSTSFSNLFFVCSHVSFNYLCMWLRRPCSRSDIGHTRRSLTSHRKPQESTRSPNTSRDGSVISWLQPRGQGSSSLCLRVHSQLEPRSHILWRKLSGIQRGSVLVRTPCQELVEVRWRKKTTRASFLCWWWTCGCDSVALCWRTPDL